MSFGASKPNIKLRVRQLIQLCKYPEKQQRQLIMQVVIINGCALKKHPLLAIVTTGLDKQAL
jgi:hypothetical protein